jgi:hypothetical protein
VYYKFVKNVYINIYCKKYICFIMAYFYHPYFSTQASCDDVRDLLKAEFVKIQINGSVDCTQILLTDIKTPLELEVRILYVIMANWYICLGKLTLEYDENTNTINVKNVLKAMIDSQQ